MPGSAQNISCINFSLNTAVAKVFKDYADELEGAEDFHEALNALIKRELTAHQRIIFNGNGYDDEWVAEAERRGLPNLKTTPEALACYDEFIDLFEEMKVLTKTELLARQDILLEEYHKLINIEAKTMIDMTKKDILPAVGTYMNELSITAANKKAVGVPTDIEVMLLNKLTALSVEAYAKLETLISVDDGRTDLEGNQAEATYAAEKIIPAMEALRAVVDELEVNTAEKYWPMPSYEKLLFGV